LRKVLKESLAKRMVIARQPVMLARATTMMAMT
jgi:hypothetical protein